MNATDNAKLINSKEFAYSCRLSFEMMAEEWKAIADNNTGLISEFAASVTEKFSKTHQLRGVINDLQVIDENLPLIRELLSLQFPANETDRIIRASSLPFNFIFFLKTPRFEKEINLREDTNLTTLGIDPAMFNVYNTVNAALIILKVVYKRPIIVPNPVIISVPDNNSGLTRYYRLNIDARYVKVHVNGEVPELDESKLMRALEEFNDTKQLTELFPPSVFEFHGFVTFDFLEVTDEQVLSELRFRFLQNSALLDDSNFEMLSAAIKNLLRDSEIKTGLVSFPEESDLTLRGGKNIGNRSFVLNPVCSSVCDDFRGSVYQEALSTKRSVVLTDTEGEGRSLIENRILTLGIKSLGVIPITEGGKLYGILETGSEQKGKINSVTVKKIESLVPILAASIKRSIDERETKISALIEEKCTSIHPAVKWRFREAASKLLDNSNNFTGEEMEDIVFNNLYPLYGLSDIRNSSVLRNMAIRDDLLYQLEKLSKIMLLINKKADLALIDHYLLRSYEMQSKLADNLNTGDEDDVNEFIRSELEPALRIFGEIDDEVKVLKDEYFAVPDQQNSPGFRNRNLYDRSVFRINNLISHILDEENAKAQMVYPHFFEKYKTDGVEHSAYIGQSLVKNRVFDLIYLRNLRLWQIQVVCRIIAESCEIKSQLPLSVDTTSLILAQSSNLSIRFRKDEKKFDADGTYNLRYEIMKKRIDKVRLRTSEERLTQPGLISVVYSQNREYDEYRKYFDYLIKKKILKGVPEVLELEDLQGVSGLKALRAEVNCSASRFAEPLESKERISFLEKEIPSF